MILFATFETELSSYGGLGAVMKMLPPEVGSGSCAIIAPHFPRLTDLDAWVRKGALTEHRPLFTFQVLIRGQAYPVEVILAAHRSGLRIFMLSSPDFFQATESPYVNPCDRTRPLHPYRNPINGEKLTEDALFFCIAVPQAMAELAKEGLITDRHVVLHLQDWETAGIAQAVRRIHLHPVFQTIKCVLTIHNPYDKPLHRQNSQRVCDLAEHMGLALRQSVLEQVIPLLDAPVSTVSAHFAHELRNEVLYTQIFCPHLQRVFKRRGLVGIDNGFFGVPDFPFSEAARADAEAGRFATLQAEKWERRKELADLVARYRTKLAADRHAVAWGGALDLADPAIPVFLVLGRDDPRQKGFDTVVEAIRMLPRGAARFIFTVMPGDEGLLGLRFLQKLAEERPDEVSAFPMRVEKTVFTALLRGASFLVMGSMYEPFGAANEGYLHGMPVVARATGGLVQQVVPHRQCFEDDHLLSIFGQALARQYHGTKAAPTGILYREHVSFADEVEGWRELIDCGYWEQNPKADRLESRRSILLFQEMVGSAAAALQLAIKVYADQPHYAAMIFSGWNMLPQFQWQRAVASYREQLYEAARAPAESRRPAARLPSHASR